MSLRIKNIASIRYGLSQPPPIDDDGCPFIRATNVDNGRIVDRELMRVRDAMPGPARDARLRTGDIIVVRSGAYTGDSSIIPARYDGSLAGYDMIVRATDRVVPSYLAWCLLSAPVRDGQFSLVTARAAQPHLNAEDLGNCEIAVPNLDVQKVVCRYLDRRTATIDALVEKKQRLVERLREKRQALITEAVTRGLDPNVPRKASGIESVGEVPSHWRLLRLMHLTQPDRPITYGIVLPGPHVDGGIPVVKSGDCHPGKLRRERLKCTTPEIEAPYARARLRSGDLVIAIRGSVGAAAIVPPDVEGANLTQDAARIAPTQGVINRWLLYAVQSSAVWAQLEAGVLGATVQGINIRDLKRPIVPTPPLDEQRRIADHLDAATARLDRAVAAIAAQLDRLREYRQALITEAVTGRIPLARMEAP